MTGSTKLEKKLLKNPSPRFFYFNNRKDLEKHSNQKIYFTHQSSNTKHKPFQFISWSNFLEGSQDLSSGIWGKLFTNQFIKCADGYFSFAVIEIPSLTDSPLDSRSEDRQDSTTDQRKSHGRQKIQLQKRMSHFFSTLFWLSFFIYTEISASFFAI